MTTRMERVRSAKAKPVARYSCKTGKHGSVVLYIQLERGAAYCPCGALKREEA